jgi:hypothetical protein
MIIFVYKLKAMSLINWRELSTHLTTKPTTIRQTKIPKKYREATKELMDFIEYWRSKHEKK